MQWVCIEVRVRSDNLEQQETTEESNSSSAHLSSVGRRGNGSLRLVRKSSIGADGEVLDLVAGSLFAHQRSLLSREIDLGFNLDVEGAGLERGQRSSAE